jgi:hypothetical protein
MSVPPRLSALIEQCLANYLAGPPDPRQGTARRYDALPVYSDLGGDIFLTASGSLIFVDGETGEQAVLPRAPPNLRLVALVAAAEKFSDLAALVPKRPESAAECSYCCGTGRKLQLRCGKCSGLGWECAV